MVALRQPGEYLPVPLTAARDLPANTSSRMAEVIGALSLAIDIASGQTMAHSQHAAYIGTQLVDALNLGDAMKSDVLYGCLLADVGCTYTSGRWANLLQGDELQLAKDIYVLNPRNFGEMFHSVWRAVAPGAALPKKLWVLGHLMLNFKQAVPQSMSLRCEKGREISASLGFSHGVQEAILYAFEHWDGNGSVYGLKSSLIPLSARLVILAQIAEASWARGGVDHAMAAVADNAGHWLDPDLAAAFAALAAKRDFRRGYASDTLMGDLLELEPSSHRYMASEAKLDEVIAAFSTLIDIKSEWTITHSHGVAATAEAIARAFGLPATEVIVARRAALLHDLGKIGVPNSILDKPGALTSDERAVIERHPQFTAEILGHAGILRPVAPIAGGHHERLDGAGYPNRTRGEDLPLTTRIVAVADVFQALSVDRPYRPALDPEQALGIMRRDLGRHLDPDCFAVLRSLL